MVSLVIDELDDDDKVIHTEVSSAYDVMGNPTTYRGMAMTWNEFNRPTSLVLEGDTTITYEYDIHGKRTKKNGMTFVYDKDGKMLAQSNGVAFLYDHIGKIGFTYEGETYLYRKNVQGDVVALLDSNGVVVASYEYDAWGNHRVFNADHLDITNDEGYNNHVGNINPIRYRSYYFDTDSGMYWLTTRFYDPKVGRFISQDEYSYLDPESINGLNLYAYCKNNPIMMVDPNGNIAITTICLLISIGVGAVIGAAAGFGIGVAIDYADDGQVFNGSVPWYAYVGLTIGGGVVGGALGALFPVVAPATGAAGAAGATGVAGLALVGGETVVVAGAVAIEAGLAVVLGLGLYFSKGRPGMTNKPPFSWVTNEDGMQAMLDNNGDASKAADDILQNSNRKPNHGAGTDHNVLKKWLDRIIRKRLFK